MLLLRILVSFPYIGQLEYEKNCAWTTEQIKRAPWETNLKKKFNIYFKHGHSLTSFCLQYPSKGKNLKHTKNNEKVGHRNTLYYVPPRTLNC